MKKILFIFAVFTLYALYPNTVFSQKRQVTELGGNDLLPIDEKIKIGKLENGLSYFIRENHKPEKRAELRLAVKVGSVYEDDDQLGLAHFVEHMAFNGTKHFRKQDLVGYLESIGMKFGPEVNAYTGFEETVYMLQVPTDSNHIFEKAFLILEDWAHNISFENEEIDKERGVIIEEWRLRQGAEERIRNKEIPVIYNNSRFAERLPIGKKEVIENFKYETLKRFYYDWYRPDLMAIIAIGDFNACEIESLIKKRFSPLSNPQNYRKRSLTQVPDHKDTLVCIVADKEATMSRFQIIAKKNAEKVKTVNDFRNRTIQGLFNSILSGRLLELTKRADPLFMYGFSEKVNIVGSKDAYCLGAGYIKDNKITESMESVLAEYYRIKQFGITVTELEREKSKFLRNLEQAFNERDKTESEEYAGNCVGYFLSGGNIMDIENRFRLSSKIMPTIKSEEVNKLSKSFLTDSNLVVLINLPEKDSLKIPGNNDIMKVFDSIKKINLLPYEDKLKNIPLLEKTPASSKVIKVKNIKEIGVLEWTLENRVKVVLKPTDFKNDEILFTSFSPGGASLVNNKDYYSALSSCGIIIQSGLGKFSSIELQKFLSGKIVSVYPMISDYEEGISGNCSTKDFEVMLQIIYLYFTSPKKDSSGFQSYISQLKSMLLNAKDSPEIAFNDTVSVIMAQYHPRRLPYTENLLREIDLERAIEIYKDRFADASDFTFFFVGKFEPDSIKPLIEKYIGGLPSLFRKENRKDEDIKLPKGVIDKPVKKGIESKSRVQILFSGEFDFSRRNRYLVESLKEILNIKLREAIREDKSGTYDVSVYWYAQLFPNPEYVFTVDFGCAPERTEELTRTLFEVVDSIKNFGPGKSYIKKVKEIQKRDHEINLKRNGYWLNVLYSRYLYNEDPKNILSYPALIQNLDNESIRKTAKKHLNNKNYVKVVLYPEK